MAELRGTYDELMSKDFYDGKSFRYAYLRITLTDEEDVVDAKSRMSVVYPNILSVRYDNSRTAAMGSEAEYSETRGKSPSELFSDFFEMRAGKPMNEEQRGLVDGLIEDIWGE